MQDGARTFMTSGRTRTASCAEECKWVTDSWHALLRQVIIKAFKKVGLKTAATELSDSEAMEDTDELFVESDILDLFYSDSPKRSDFDVF